MKQLSIVSEYSFIKLNEIIVGAFRRLVVLSILMYITELEDSNITLLSKFLL